MARIQVAKFAANDTFLFVIDTNGRVWHRGIGLGGQWTLDGELPDDTKPNNEFKLVTEKAEQDPINEK